MKKIMLLCLALAFFAMAALAEDVTRKAIKFTSAGSDDGIITLRDTGVYNHRLTWTGAGTRTTCTITIKQSTTGAFDGEETDLIADTDCTTDGAATATGYCNYALIKVTALTGTGNTVFPIYNGTTLSSNSVTVSNLTADSAEGSAAGTTPALVGYQANTAEATAVDSGDAIKARSTLVGAPLSWGPALPGDTWEYSAIITDGNEVTIKAGEANYYICVTALFVQNGSATPATFTFKEATGGTQRWIGYAAASGGGFAKGDGKSVVFCAHATAADTTKGIFGISSAVANPLYVNVRGFRTKVAPVY